MSRTLFPKISTYHQEWLSVTEGHQLYLEVSGNANGIPVLYLHGGPGGGSSENHRRYFDPTIYKIILFDQRGCGRSKPSPSIVDNTSELLVEDIETIRQHLNIKEWLIAGGSWGTTLAMVYGISHPERVLGFILRGIFLGTQQEFDWLYKPGGAQRFFPEYYDEFVENIPELEKHDPLTFYNHQLHSNNEVAAISASKSWYLWELRLSSLEHHHIDMAKVEDAHQALCMAKLSSHYFSHNCFLPPNYIMDNINKVAHIPSILIHGRYDMVCQLYIAKKVTDQWDNAHLHILPCAGHSGFERQTIDAFCKATDTMAEFLNEESR
jgi:proline iminopeptidase